MHRPGFLCVLHISRLLLMAAVGNVLWTVLPQLFLRFPSLQKKAAENVTLEFPYSDLVHRPFSEEMRLEMKEEARRMFYWGYDNYIAHAFPFDELNPINCTGRGHDWKDPSNVNINDVLGDYSLTLVDTLDTLAVMGNQSEFIRAVRLIIDNVSFDGPCTTVQVFEVTIRVLGSLLSAHLLVIDSSQPFGMLSPSNYKGELLDLARDLATRILPAFETSITGLPHPRVNLCDGVSGGLSGDISTNTAAAGTLTVEFTLLSRLLGDPVYEGVARRAVRALWDRRHRNTGLVGNEINIHSGQWTGRMSGIGAGVDSFYEYLLKSYILFGEQEDLEMFKGMYNSIMKYLRRGQTCRSMFNSSKGPITEDGYVFFVNADYATGNIVNSWLDALSASFAGVQVLAGDLDEAICTHALYYSIWRRYDAMPERFDWRLKTTNLRFYPLRPELIESTYLLYQATQNPFYLHVGTDILRSLEKHAKARCGYATLHDVEDKSQEDRMESFFLSETCKYLYLLFDKDNILNRKALQYIFTTEGHVLYVDPAYRVRPWETDRDRQSKSENESEEMGGEEMEKKDKGEGNKMAVARKDDNLIGRSCAYHLHSRKHDLPLPSDRLGSFERLVGLHNQQQSGT